jgi:hypothetical protein
MLRQADVDLRYTHDPMERNRRVLGAIKVLEWMLLENLKHEIEASGKNHHEREA